MSAAAARKARTPAGEKIKMPDLTPPPEWAHRRVRLDHALRVIERARAAYPGLHLTETLGQHSSYLTRYHLRADDRAEYEQKVDEALAPVAAERRRDLILALARVYREGERLGDECIGVANAILHEVTARGWKECPATRAPWPLGDLAGWRAEIAALDHLRKRLGVRRRNGGCTW